VSTHTDYFPYAKEVDFVPCDADDKDCVTIGEWQLGVGEALQPLLRKHGVDIYNAGHVHSYEQTYPICDFTKGLICDGKQDYNEPTGTVHITDGRSVGVERQYNQSTTPLH
jgi:hypothetical protein